MGTRQPFAGQSGESGLVPEDLDYVAVAPFIYLTLAALELLAFEPAVKEYTRAYPDAHRGILALSAAVASAGTRVRDTGQMHDEFDQNLRFYTADEIWLFDLAIDVIAMLGTQGGLTPGTHAQIISDLRSLDQDAGGHHWKKEVRKAGDGPAAFRELRAHVPRRR